MAEVTVDVQGLAELERRLLQLPDELSKVALKEAAAAGAEVFRREMRLRIHSVTGKLKRSIVRSVRLQGSKGEITATVGPSRKQRYIARFLEFGTKAHLVAAVKAKALKLPGGLEYAVIHHPGSAPHPFIRPAFDVGKSAAVDAFARRLAEAITRLGK